jgi:hypothetical protein
MLAANNWTPKIVNLLVLHTCRQLIICYVRRWPEGESLGAEHEEYYDRVPLDRVVLVLCGPLAVERN